ncbi:hypothetical protein A0256_21305 [Mucilaginibacter sp. PAMC 26640]|nr:hypothetical protein A0256_21305 [Mucilaginibacter sp. PAMC 26640]
MGVIRVIKKNPMLSNTGINKVILMGTTSGPFLNVTDRNQEFLCFDLITTEYIKKGYDQIEHQEYHHIKASEKLITQESLSIVEGQTLYIEGKIQTTSFVDEQRIKRYRLEIIANRLDILSTIDAAVSK